MKLPKHKRKAITYQIEDMLENYCRADCPYANLNTPSPVCMTCPVSVHLRSFGDQLGADEVTWKHEFSVPKHLIQLAKKNGITYQTLRSRLLDGIPDDEASTRPMAPRLHWTKEEDALLLELVASGATLDEMMKRIDRPKEGLKYRAAEFRKRLRKEAKGVK